MQLANDEMISNKYVKLEVNLTDSLTDKTSRKEIYIKISREIRLKPMILTSGIIQPLRIEIL